MRETNLEVHLSEMAPRARNDNHGESYIIERGNQGQPGPTCPNTPKPTSIPVETSLVAGQRKGSRQRRVL